MTVSCAQEDSSAVVAPYFQIPVRMAVFVSGKGSNLLSILESCRDGVLRTIANVVLVVSSRSSAPAVEIARTAGIDTFVYEKDIPSIELHRMLHEHRVELIALAGYLRLVEPDIVANYRERLINVHPALLPKFGGQGMYGSHTHAAVLAAGESITGVTIHLVDENYDSGRILRQEQVPVHPGDSIETLAERVQIVERRLYPQALGEYITNHVILRHSV